MTRGTLSWVLMILAVLGALFFYWPIGATGAGYVTVVVPWWDPASQQVTCTRNTPAGVIGDISVPAANRTNTGFRIVSANAADTSTVDWQMSPLGRDIRLGSP